MKRMKLLLIMSVLSVMNSIALPLSEARREAWFLTDKMAYELDLTAEQYDYVYQVNLDYFLHINSPYDCRGKYWGYRNADLYYILHDWQYTLYKVATYFFTPIQWINNSWHHIIYNHYKKGKHYFSKPICYNSYNGGQWKHRNIDTPSAYRDHRFKQGVGMRDNYHKGQPINSSQKPKYERPNNQKDKNRPSINRSTDKTKNNPPSVSRQQKKVGQVTRTNAQTRQPSKRGSNKREFGR